MVDKEADIPEKYPQIVVEKLTTGNYDLWQIDTPNDIDKKNQYVIIATTDEKLGLPLLPAIEENITREEAKEVAKTVLNPRFYESIQGGEMHCFHEGYNAGYKAASAKKYTEEDMRKAIKEAFRGGFDLSESEGNSWDYGKVRDNILKSMNSTPIAVEVEMDFVHFSNASSSAELISLEGLNEYTNIFPKAVNNFVTVKKWIYE